MAFVSAALFTRAVDQLKDAHPLSLVAIPALLKSAGSAAVAMTGVQYGAGPENELLNSYFRFAGAPDPSRPYRAIWTDLWVNQQWAGKSMQRQRKGRADSSKVFVQTKGTPGSLDTWALRPHAGQEMRDGGANQVALIDMAIWFGRDQDVADLPALLDWFKTEFGFDPIGASDLIGTLYSDGVPAEYSAEPLSQQPLSAEDYAATLSTVPPPVQVTDPLDALIATLEQKVEAERFVLPDGLVRSVMTGWLRGDLVVLVGQPGTGKTRFASLLMGALASHLGIAPPITIPIHQEFDESDLIGYESLAGKPVLRKFSDAILKSSTPLDPHLVIFEEFNLATVENYLSSVLIALQETSRSVILPGGETTTLPRDIFAIATCNSYLDEETRTRLSYPTKRRAAVIVMPNVLADRYLANGKSEISDLAVERIQQESAEVDARIAAGLGSAFDGMRAAALRTVGAVTDVSQAARDLLEEIVAAILDTPEGASYLTLGLLRDVALELAYANRTEQDEVDALVRAVALKLLPQLRGPHSRADSLVDILGGRTGADHVARVVARMQTDSPDELTTFV